MVAITTPPKPVRMTMDVIYHYRRLNRAQRDTAGNWTVDGIPVKPTAPKGSRVRANGTVVTDTDGSLIAKVEAIRAIVKTHGYAVVDGVMVDLFTASAIMAVYDALNDKNRVHFMSLPLHKMATVAFKLVK